MVNNDLSSLLHSSNFCKEMLVKYDGGASKDVYKMDQGSMREPETKHQSTVWVFEPEPNPTKVVCGKNHEANGGLFLLQNRSCDDCST